MCSNPMGLVSSNVRKAGHSGYFARRSERVLRISGGTSQSSSDKNFGYRNSELHDVELPQKNVNLY